MRLPRGMTKKGGRYYARLYQKDGSERSMALGQDLDRALVTFYRARAGFDHPSEATRALTVREAGERWLDEYVETARCQKGRRMARRRLEDGLAAYMGERCLSEVTKADLRRYRLWLESERPDLKPLTIAHYLADARCFFRWCEDADLIMRAPIPMRLLPRVQESPPDRLGDEEVAKLVSLPDPWGFVLRLALATGLRWGELTRAKRTDVTPDGWLTVHQTKSGRMRRIPLERRILEEILARTGRLVPYGELSPGTFTGTVRRKTGLKSFHMHQTRHTFACRWLEGGGSVDSLQQVLGHQDQRTTRRYGRPSDRFVREEAFRVFTNLTGKNTGNSASVRA